jgi:hypothetical protein
VLYYLSLRNGFFAEIHMFILPQDNVYFPKQPIRIPSFVFDLLVSLFSSLPPYTLQAPFRLGRAI